MAVLLNVILPVILVAGVAALAQRYVKLDVRTTSRAAFYLFAPALVFDSLANSTIGGAEFGQIAVTLIATTLVLWGLGEGLGAGFEGGTVLLGVGAEEGDLFAGIAPPEPEPDLEPPGAAEEVSADFAATGLSPRARASADTTAERRREQRRPLPQRAFAKLPRLTTSRERSGCPAACGRPSPGPGFEFQVTDSFLVDTCCQRGLRLRR